MPKKILVVEDEVDILKLVIFRLEKFDYEVFAAADGQEALDLIAKNPPDLILLDLILPVLDGYEVCKYLKSDSALKKIPVILLTASATSNMLDKLKETKADDYLVKPFEPQDLLSKIKKFLDKEGDEEKNLNYRG